MEQTTNPNQFSAYCHQDKATEVFEELERMPLDDFADTVYSACTWCGAEGIFARTKDPSRYVQSPDETFEFTTLKQALVAGNPVKYYKWKRGEADQ